MRKHLVAALAAVLGLALAAPPAVAQAPKQGGRLIYATGTDPQTLDPQFVTDVPTSRVVMQIHETLITTDEKGAIKPALAESWSVSDDKKAWTLKLRQNVKFHDGTPFDAEAVKATFTRLLDPAIASPRRSTAAVIKEVKVVDPHTVAFTTAEPFAPLLAQLTAYNLAIMSPKAMQESGTKYRDKPVGTGPFMLESWSPGEKVVLKRFDGYWGKPANLQQLEIRAVPEDSARVLLLLSGEVDVIASVPTVMLDRLQKSPNVKLLKEMGYRTIYVGLNNKLKPFDNPKVRQAVAHAINKEQLVSGILRGVGTLGGGFESPVIIGAHQNLKPYEYNPEKARQLLAEAGYPNGLDTAFYVPTGRYLMDRQLGEAIQAQLAQVGIRARIEAPEWGTLSSMLDSKDKVPMFLLGKGSPTGDLDFTLTLTAATGGRMNHFNFSNPKVDELIQQQRTAVDPAQRREILDDIQEAFYAETPAVVLFYEDQIFAARSNVQGVVVLPNEFVSFHNASKQ